MLNWYLGGSTLIFFASLLVFNNSHSSASDTYPVKIASSSHNRPSLPHPALPISDRDTSKAQRNRIANTGDLDTGRVRSETSRQLPAGNQKGQAWVVAEGVVPFGEDTTLSDAKVRSRNEARRKAIEAAVGTFINARTIIYNYAVAEDLVQATVRGMIVAEEVLEEGAREVADGRGAKALLYVTKLKAQVQPIKAQHKSDFIVRAEFNKQTFREQEEMEIKVSSSQDAYLHIFNVSDDNSVTVLFPNRFAQKVFIPGKREVTFPSEEQRTAGIRLRVFTPRGHEKAVERIKVIATTTSKDLVKSRFKEGVFQVYDGKDTGLINDLLKELSLLDDSEWTEASLTYEVRK